MAKAERAALSRAFVTQYAEGVEIVQLVVIPITWALTIFGALIGGFALIDTLGRRADSFVAADKQSKTVWMGINGFAGFILISSYWFIGPPNLLWVAALIGALVYLVDVRPRLKDVQRGSRW